MPSARATLKKYLLPLKFLAALAIFGLLSVRMDWSMMGDLAQNIDIRHTGIALLLIILQLGMLAYRWQIFMNAEKALVTYRQSLNIIVASQLANFLFITSVGGIVVRIALAQYYGLSLLKSLCAAVTDRFMTLLAIIVFAVLFIPALLPVIPHRLIESVIVIVLICLVVAFIFPTMILGFLMPLILKYRPLASTVIYLRRLARTHELWIPVAASSFFAQLFYFLAVCFTAQAVSLEFNIYQMIAMLPMITIIASLPVGLGGWGIREGAFVFGLGLIGIPAESAFLISVQIGLLGIASTLVSAIPALLTGNLQSALRKAKTYALSKRTS
jgi:uncharacterized membrane protein YbhN (UPF0104 family)